MQTIQPVKIVSTFLSLVTVTLMCFAYSITANAQQSTSVNVESFAGLKAAIAEANERPAGSETLINVLADIEVPESDALLNIISRITLAGGRLSTSGNGPDTLFEIGPSGDLGVRDMIFVDWPQRGETTLVFDNSGLLLLNRVRFELILGDPFCFRGGCNQAETPIVLNRSGANLRLTDVVFADLGLKQEYPFNPDNRLLINEGAARLIRTQMYLDDIRGQAPLLNSGNLRLENVSILVRNLLLNPTLPLVTTTDSARTVAANSAIDGFTGEFCQHIISEGYNTTTSTNCSWSAPGDQTGTPSGMIWRTPNTAIEGLVRTEGVMSGLAALIPSAASPLIDSAGSGECPEKFDGNGDGIARCDRGAWEVVPTGLVDGGINGLFFNPDADGHYVYILQTNNTTLVMWNTFDDEGNQAWVFGTGTLVAGRSLIAEAYINRTEGFTPDGLLTPVEAEPWGQIDVDMSSCNVGVVAYRSVLPEFGSGQFPINRLAFVKQLGCIDP